jgi:O-antigen/teichoic acid export membrane protein
MRKLLNVLASRAAMSVSSLVFAVLFGRIIVDTFGFETFAALSLISSLPALLAFADLGAGAALVNASSDLLQEPENLQARRRVVASSSMLFFSSLAILVIASITTALDLWPLFLGDAAQNIPSLEMGVFLVLVALSASVINAIPTRLLQSWQRNGLVFWIAVIGPPLSVVAAIILLELGYPAGIIAAAPAFSAAIAAAICWWPASRQYPGHLGRDLLRVRPARLDVAEVLHIGGSSLVVTLGVVLGLQADRLILSHFSSATELGYYALVAPVYIAALGILNAVGQNIWIKYRRMMSNRTMNMQVLGRDILRLGILGILGSCGIIVGAPFVALLIGTGDAAGLPWELVFAFAGLLLLQALHVPSAMLLTDKAGFALQRNIVAVVSTLNFAISCMLAAKYGAIGVCLGSIVGILIQIPTTFYFAFRSLRSIPD